MTDELEKYIGDHSDSEPKELHCLWRDCNLHLTGGRMASGHVQGRLLKMLVRMIRPRRVLELGTYAGYSALCMAEGMDAGGVVDTVEIFDELEDFIREHLAMSAHGDKVHPHFGDASEVVPRLGMQYEYDMVFIDADKRRYCEYYELVKPLVRRGGFILADNTLWDGHVVEQDRHDAQTDGIRAFNELVAGDPDVEKVILPIRDGLTLIYVKP